MYTYTSGLTRVCCQVLPARFVVIVLASLSSCPLRLATQNGVFFSCCSCCVLVRIHMLVIVVIAPLHPLIAIECFIFLIVCLILMLFRCSETPQLVSSSGAAADRVLHFISEAASSTSCLCCFLRVLFVVLPSRSVRAPCVPNGAVFFLKGVLFVLLPSFCSCSFLRPVRAYAATKWTKNVHNVMHAMEKRL